MYCTPSCLEKHFSVGLKHEKFKSISCCRAPLIKHASVFQTFRLDWLDVSVPNGYHFFFFFNKLESKWQLTNSDRHLTFLDGFFSMNL